MSTHVAPLKSKLLVGIFTVLGLVLIFALTVYVNDKPYWWRGCNYFFINLEDASGIKTKSPVKSRGLEVGYIDWVALNQDHVELGICLTAPVKALPTTRAYVRGEGFMGDKFIDLKPLEYIGQRQQTGTEESEAESDSKSKEGAQLFRQRKTQVIQTGALWHLFLSPSLVWAQAQSTIARPKATSSPVNAEALARSSNQTATRGARQIPVGSTSQDVQQLVDEVDALVGELTVLTNNLKTVMNPDEMQKTMKQLSVTLEHASKTLSPEGNLTTTAQRVLVKLESAVEQLQDQMTKVNQGEGSVGKVLNDERYADLLEDALKSINQLLGGVAGTRFMVDLGAESVPALDRTRAWIQLGIWPTQDRYYLLGAGQDPRGRVTPITIQTTSGGTTSSVTQIKTEPNGLVITAMLGKVLWRRLDLNAGILYNDGTVGMGLLLGPRGWEERIRIYSAIYSHDDGNGAELNARVNIRAVPLSGPYLKTVYLHGGLEGVKKINGELAWTAGAGLRFDDRDIKMLFAFR